LGIGCSKTGLNDFRISPKDGHEFTSHETVNHSIAEYARGLVHTNTIEGFFSIFKRGMRGMYQHCSEAHLFRCLAEFDFRYSNREALEPAYRSIGKSVGFGRRAFFFSMLNSIPWGCGVPMGTPHRTVCPALRSP
jgi:ISXO2 transposase-like protein